MDPRPIALLSTDVAGSTRILESDPAGYQRGLAHHHHILRQACGAENGGEFHDSGDGLTFAFPSAAGAARAAQAVQVELARTGWPPGAAALEIRVALHWGGAEFREGQYRGPGLNVAARLLAAAHARQIVASAALAARLADEGGEPVTPLGTYRLRGFAGSEPVHQLAYPGQPESFPPLRAAHARRHNLPPLTRRLLGRDAELEGIARGLASPGKRCLVLTGTGGSGKSHLALAAAHRALESFDHQVLWVPLAGLQSASRLPRALLRALAAGTKAEGPALDTFCEALAGSPCLLVLDNFEHLAAEGAPLLATLLARLPGMRCLVTSRTALGLEAEEILPLGPLSVPAESDDRETLRRSGAVRMFLDRARQAVPDFELTDANASSIGALCRLLGGIPLGIELATARLPVFSPAELHASLCESVSEEDRGLAAGLEDVFEWSRRKLPAEVDRTFAQLAVFQGGWTAAQAAAVCGLAGVDDAIGHLHFLLHCRLADVRDTGAERRFSMLEPLRRFLQRRQPELAAEARQRHRALFHELTVRTNRAMSAPGALAACDALEAEIDNVLAALNAAEDTAARLSFAVDLHDFARVRGHAAALRPALRFEPAEDIAPATRAFALHAAAVLDIELDETARAAEGFRRSIPHFEQSGNASGVAGARTNLATLMYSDGDLAGARAVYLETLPYFEQENDTQHLIAALSQLAGCEEKMGRYEQAFGYISRAVDRAREADETELPGALHRRAFIRYRWQRFGEAAREMETALSLAVSFRVKSEFPAALMTLALIAADSGQPGLAARFVGSAGAAADRYRVALNAEMRAELAQLESAYGNAPGPVDPADPATWRRDIGELLAQLSTPDVPASSTENAIENQLNTI